MASEALLFGSMGSAGNNEVGREKEQIDKLGNVFLVYSNKGGTGKTTISSQMLHHLKKDEQVKKILIIENDQQEKPH